MNKKRILLVAASSLVFGAATARADDYTDLLDILRAKGSLTRSEYNHLLAKHLHAAQPAAQTDATAEHAALQAAASAATAQAQMRQMQADMDKTQAMINEPDIIRAMPYKPGAGLTMKLGDVDFNVSGIVNAFYTYSAAAPANAHTAVAGGLSDASGFDSSSVRNGLLPGAIILSASTTQDGIDVSAVFGAYPGINSASVGLLNANNGGTATALGTSGVDFRKTYMTLGTPAFGTVKLGRDIGIFGQDAILNDQTLLGVGATGGNADPANTSLGRIGLGYLYTDFMPQISYMSPAFAGFQLNAGIFQPLNEFNFSGLSAASGEHNAPLFEGRVTYDTKGDGWSTHVWAGALAQTQDGITTPTAARVSKTATAGEAGASLTVGPVGMLAYGYRARGVGTTGLFFDGLAPNGQFRDSDGGYVQAFVTPVTKLKLAASYGESSLYLARGEVDPGLVRRNESEVAGAYYSLTDWVTLVSEYAHTTSKSHAGNGSSANAISAGAILFY